VQPPIVIIHLSREQITNDIIQQICSSRERANPTDSTHCMEYFLNGVIVYLLPFDDNLFCY